MSENNLAGFIWSVANILRGDYKQSMYGRIILPFTVLRRLDCILEPTKEQVLQEHERLQKEGIEKIGPFLTSITGRQFYNTSSLNFSRLLDDPNNIKINLESYLSGFSANARDIFDHFEFQTYIQQLEDRELLYPVTRRFAEVDLHPGVVDNRDMGNIFEELIRKFSELSNETAGHHFTPREVIQLMVDLIFSLDDDALSVPGTVRRIYDPAAGTGGMLSVAEDHLLQMNPRAKLVPFAQELNSESYAICKADMLIKGHDVSNIVYGNSFTQDGFKGEKFDYMLSNPPFGDDWKKIRDFIEAEHKEKGHAGRFGPGLPRVSDGSLLFLLHLISKMDRNGTRFAIVLNGSPLFTGEAGSGESEIRRWILENDLLEAIVSLPTDLFYNTGIQTYVWVLSNKKEPERQGKVQLINSTDWWQPMRKSLGNKRRMLGENDIDKIGELYGKFEDSEESRIFHATDFGYRKITVERPLRLNFCLSMQRIERIKEAKAFQNLATSKKKGENASQEMEQGKKTQQAILHALENNADEKLFYDREAFSKHLKKVLDNFSINQTLFKAILNALSERDEEAPVCCDKKGNPEPDPELRDTEIVPLNQDVYEYFEREVTPHVPDAWIDTNKKDLKDNQVGIVGYEINFNRYFYKYEPPEPLEEIEAKIKDKEQKIAELLQEVME